MARKGSPEAGDRQTAHAVGPESPTGRVSALAEQAWGRYKTVGEMVLDVLRQAILGGTLPPGTRLRQDALAQELAVSRMPVRSALFQLASEGLVDFHPHRGAVVRMLSASQIEEIYEIRLLLESYALRRAFATMTPARLAALGELAERLDTADSGEQFAELSLAFYRQLYDAEHHAMLVSLVERLHSEVGRHLLGRRLLDRSHFAHANLLRYAWDGDAEAAVVWLTQHLGQVRDELLALAVDARAEE
ncbi:MAG: GntR family transcriptional regulator [Acidimicrobiales bacterium]